MEADFLIELGRDDESLEFPWQGPEGGPKYYDLKRHPEHLQSLPEARQFPPLGQLLATVNSEAGALETAKCDVWASRDIYPEEEIFEASCKFGGYVDLLFRDAESQVSLERHEQFAQSVTKVLKGAGPVAASAEFLVRRCYFANDRAGFYITCYVFGYGNDEGAAEQCWEQALLAVRQALLEAVKPKNSAGKNVSSG